MEDCKVACSTPAFRLRLINLSKLARCSHQGLFREPGLRSHSNCLQAFSSLKRSIGNKCYQNSSLLPLPQMWGRWVLYTQLLTPPERSGGVEHSHFPFLLLSPSLHNSSSEASGVHVKCLPLSLSLKAGFLKAAFICFTIAPSPPLFEISHDRAALT